MILNKFFFLSTTKKQIHFHPVKITPTLQNRPSQVSRESSVAFSLFKEQFCRETALNSSSMKVCRKELLR